MSRTRKTSGRGLYVLLGFLLVVGSVGAFIFLLSRSEEDKVSVLVTREDIAEGQSLTASDFRTEEILDSSSLRYLAAGAFAGVNEGEIVAGIDLQAGTIINRDLLTFVSEDGSGTAEQRVTFSIEIPSQGFAAGVPSEGTRVLLIQLLPARGEGPSALPRTINPIQVEVVQDINGNRISFLAIPERATRLQVAQLEITERGGYIFLWEVPIGYNEEDLLAQAIAGFNAASPN